MATTHIEENMTPIRSAPKVVVKSKTSIGAAAAGDVAVLFIFHSVLRLILRA